MSNGLTMSPVVSLILGKGHNHGEQVIYTSNPHRCTLTKKLKYKDNSRL